MSRPSNVIITSGLRNQVIHVPVNLPPDPTTRSASPAQKASSSASGQAVVVGVRTGARSGVHSNGQHANGQVSRQVTVSLANSKHNGSVQDLSGQEKTAQDMTGVVYLTLNQDYDNDDERFESEDSPDSGDIRTLEYDDEEHSGSLNSFEKNNLLLPRDDAEIKEEPLSDNENVDEFCADNEMDEQQLAEIGASKAQFVCEGCGRGFCYIGWLDRHKLICKEFPKVISKKQVSKDTAKDRHDKNKSVSLTGRLDEMINCPNKGCTFSSYWIQSLNKHVSSACRFSSDSSTKTLIQNQTSPLTNLNKIKPLSCSICSATCSDYDDHIRHMREVHNKKHHFRCTECGEKFFDKMEVEKHVAEHIRKAKDNNSANTFSRRSSTSPNKSNNAGDNTNTYRRRNSTSPNKSPKKSNNNAVDNRISTDDRVIKPSATSLLALYRKKVNESPINTPSPPVLEQNDPAVQTWPIDDKSLLNDQELWNCMCGKNYVSFRSYQIHSSTCEKAILDRPPVLEQMPKTTTMNESSFHGDENHTEGVLFRLKRDDIIAVHRNDSICKCCKREMATALSVAQHLSRKAMCREWYCDNLTRELEKLKETRDSRDNRDTRDIRDTRESESVALSAAKRQRLSLDAETNSTSSRATSQMDSESKPIRRASQIAKTNLFLSMRDINEGNDDRRQMKELKGHKSIQCRRCKKIFSGKKPQVAYLNHKRRSKSCQAIEQSFDRFEALSPQKKKVFMSRKYYSTNLKPLNEAQAYYCKLCPNKKPTNRVTLGSHLTTYHGLPQVNVSTESGEDAYRCQTCRNLFVSKYFYNLHRQNCDQTSPYIGFVNKSKVLMRSGLMSKDDNFAQDNTCEFCNKRFPGPSAFNLHQKYQCVKRIQISKKSNIGLFSKTSKLITTGKSLLKKFENRPLFVGPGGRVYSSELAKLNDMAKTDSSLTLCKDCGGGPYNSYYYFLQHKREFCPALKKRGEFTKQMTSTKKSLANKDSRLNQVLQVAKKTRRDADQQPDDLDVSNEKIEWTMLNNNYSIECNTCGDKFDDLATFIHHKMNHYSQDLLIQGPSERLICELCKARVEHYQRIQQHLILHLQYIQLVKQRKLVEVRQKPQDQILNAQESDAEDVGEGEEDDDPDDPVMHCPYCRTENKSRTELFNHINNCPFRYQCSNCNNTYSAKESYLQHKESCFGGSSSQESTKQAYKCNNCGVDFKFKQQLILHQHICSKIYLSDFSGHVEDVIQKALTCGVCGLVLETHPQKLSHEASCFKDYLKQIGVETQEKTTEVEIENENENLLEKSVSSESRTIEISSDLVKKLKEKFGINKELRVTMTPFNKELISQIKHDLYMTEEDEDKQYETLKSAFLNLVQKLIHDQELLNELNQEANSEKMLIRMLNFLGEKAIVDEGISQLTRFRENLKTFLNVSIKKETLILAYQNAESVDEAIMNLLSFKCELH